MLRNVLLFFTALLLALTAGRAFWVWLGENPFNMSGATDVEFFQQLDKQIVVPIAVTGVGGRQTTIYIGLGETDLAFKWLEQAYQERLWYLALLAVDPLFDRLRGDARFTDLVRRMNLTPAAQS